ncbi:putative toxin-antitoxin system antitoxin component (TIGR02293 family) [Pseudomonas corrugata]|jgi:putative toxin-antitoxin system antitoxin component (TIGR02293 family)|uniref:antitoxin Xre/MbcA/ParS toxin-binding domain-containing protein n=1 Tax=Pseudomonas corrugata TaxID=47879 RepID=UPI002864C78B|nr:antitoxin Xre/MbcA/ParS toxin-binding domain-containing protein [Pseudomonas corrugata]MDR7285626.1 putative toxin-antitoxin system antitoxin component (TIGR02293 family) [Pseudomonas corrugata]
MLADVMRESAYRAYRARLGVFLPIPIDASDQAIHALIEAGFLAANVKLLCDRGKLSVAGREQIIPLKTLNKRLANGQRLSVDQSDRLFRVAHITAMAEVLFESDEKARRWLSKPKTRFLGQSPIAMLSTSQGIRQVEEVLIQLAEGLVF